MKYVPAFVVALACVLLVSIGCSSPDDVINTPPGADGACSNPPGANNRFVDCGNGTVTDTYTHLIWLKNAHCLGQQESSTAALDSVHGLKNGDCGLTDNSSAGDWRLPSLECPSGDRCDMTTPPSGEFVTIFAYSSCGAPHILNSSGTGCWTEGDPFSGVQSSYYWSSTWGPYWGSSLFVVHLYFGWVYSVQGPAPNAYVWPVRGGQ